MQEVDYVFHAAGLPEQWQKDPTVFEQVNVLGTQYMIEAALKAKVKRFIYTNIQDVFDLSATNFDENSKNTATHCSHYEQSKIKAQQLVDTAVAERGLPAISLHPVAIYGTGALRPTGLTALFDQLRQNEVPVLLKGGFLLVFNEDATQAHLLAEQYYTLEEMAQAIAKLRQTVRVPHTIPNFVANLLAGLGTVFSKLTGRPLLVTSAELAGLRRTGCPNGQTIKQELGWQPQSFEQGLAATLQSLESSAI